MGQTQQLIDALESIDETNILDERQNSVLAIALKNGHWQTSEALIDNNYLYSHTNKPILISACQHKKDLTQGITTALKLNSDANILNQQNRTALMTVCLLGHFNKAKELIDNGANINLQDRQGNTALMDALHSKNKKVVELLLSSEININQTNNQDETALILELKQKSPIDDIVIMLLEGGADPETRDVNKKSAWLIAKQKHPKISRLIEKHLNNVNQIELPFFSNDYQIKQKIESTPVKEPEITTDRITKNDLTTHTPNTAIPNKRVEPTINPNKTEETKPTSVNKIKSTPIAFVTKIKKSNEQEWFHAAKTGNLGGLNRMIIEGIDINCTDNKGCTALIRACGHSRRAVVSFLLQQEADMEIRSHNGSTALSSSIIGNCRRVAGLLLDNGADVNALGPSNYSYATIAAAQWNDAMLSILYRSGADVFITNKYQQNLLHIIALAAEYYNNVNNAKTSIRFLLDHGMDINAQDYKGDTALMILCGTHKYKYQVDDRNIASIAHRIIKSGAIAAITNKAGKSALDASKHHKLQQAKGVIMNALSWNES